MRSTSPRHGKSLAFGRLIRVSQGEVVIGFTPETDFHRTTVLGHGKSIIESVMAQHFGVPTRLVVDPTGAKMAPPSIAEEEAREKAVHERSVESRVRNDAALQATLRILGGEIEHIQVLERERPSVVDPEPPDESA
ncbi:MAG: hypothetical protein IRZ16_18635 [Myxococcaceae bacterium]|nr:hypothetical protein [Myxococcaceae bacterium]